jgi:hypothetical protein
MHHFFSVVRPELLEEEVEEREEDSFAGTMVVADTPATPRSL